MTWLIHLDHPCNGIDIYDEMPEHVDGVRRAQGYMTIAELAHHASALRDELTTVTYDRTLLRELAGTKQTEVERLRDELRAAQREVEKMHTYLDRLNIPRLDEYIQVSVANRVSEVCAIAEVAQGQLAAVQAELEKWREWKPDDKDLAEAQAQAGDFSSKAATLVYVKALEAQLRERDADLARSRRVAEAARNYYHAPTNYHFFQLRDAVAALDAAASAEKAEG